MEILIKAAACGVITVIFASQLKHTRRDLAALLSLAACVLIMTAALSQAGPILRYIEEMTSISGMDHSLLEILLKVCGCTIITKLTSVFIREAGEGGIANSVELCGTLISVCFTLPLLESVMDAVCGLLGG